MKTIKVIDLFNKLANGENLPKKVKYDGNIYKYHYGERDYINYNANYDANSWLFSILPINKSDFLDVELEIVEDASEETIEDIKYYFDDNIGEYVATKKDEKTIIDFSDIFLINNINEIIKYINEKEKK